MANDFNQTRSDLEISIQISALSLTIEEIVNLHKVLREHFAKLDNLPELKMRTSNTEQRDLGKKGILTLVRRTYR